MSVVKNWGNNGINYVNLRFTSQTFRGTTWQHTLTLAKSIHAKPSSEAILIIGGGRHDQLPAADSPTGQANPRTLEVLRDLTLSSGLISASVRSWKTQPSQNT